MTLVKIIVNYGNSNRFTINIEEHQMLGTLAFLFSKIIYCEINEIKYIIYNGYILGASEKYSFNKRLSDFSMAYNTNNNMHVIVSINDTGDFDNVIKNKQLQWLKSKGLIQTSVLPRHSTYEEAGNLIDIPIVLTSEQFDELITYDTGDSMTCFCGDNNELETSATLPCNHTFHSSCIETWLTSRSTKCPICAQDVRDSDSTV